MDVVALDLHKDVAIYIQCSHSTSDGTGPRVPGHKEEAKQSGGLRAESLGVDIDVFGGGGERETATDACALCVCVWRPCLSLALWCALGMTTID